MVEGGKRVGTGVVDPYGRPPEDKWGITVNLFNSKRFRDVSLGLISGQSVSSADEEVQISFQQVNGTRSNIRIRESDLDIEVHVLDLVVEAVDPATLNHPDQRGLPSPVPERMAGGCRVTPRRIGSCTTAASTRSSLPTLEDLATVAKKPDSRRVPHWVTATDSDCEAARSAWYLRPHFSESMPLSAPGAS